MYTFEFHRPTSVRDAATLLGSKDDAKLLAGGHTLLPTMKQRLASPAHLVDLTKVDGLSGIELKAKPLLGGAAGVTVGAMTRHVDVANSTVVREKIPALAFLAGEIGDPAVRHRGTIGGSVANNDPNADYPAGVLALGATIVTNKRKIEADDYFKGMFETALGADEIITALSFPIPDKAGYVKFPNPASRYALVGVFVARFGDKVRVAVTGAGANGVFRVKPFEEALAKNFAPAALDGLKVPAAGMNADIHGSAEYRAHLIGVLAKRAVTAAG